MLKTFTIEQSNEWDMIVDSFEERDAYYYSGYQKAFMLHGDGNPTLFYYDDGKTRAMNVVMKRDIAEHVAFKELQKDRLFDLSTPYGYGGFIVVGNNIESLNKEYTDYCNKNAIVSEFVRFHPVLNNKVKLSSMYDIIDLGPTITMDISDKGLIWQNLSSKNRNMIRKAIKEGVEIRKGNDKVLFDTFIDMYSKIMDKNNADDYYYFQKEFYDSIREDYSNKSTIFYALYENRIIAMAIILYANTGMHYHLSAIDMDYKSKAASNLLLYEVACWGHDKGFKSFHLGGGVGSKEDSLYSFKKAFNKNSNTVFSIGRKVFNKEIYDKLVDMRREEGNFDMRSSFFPLYRA